MIPLVVATAHAAEVTNLVSPEAFPLLLEPLRPYKPTKIT